MHISILPLAFASALSVCCAAAKADGDQLNHTFVGIMGGQTSAKLEDIGDLDFATVTARVGHDFTHWFGVEARGGTTADDDALDIDFSIPWFASALARVGWLPVDDRRIGVYALGGYTKGELEGSAEGLSQEVKFDGVSYGIGVELLANERNGLNFEYLRYIDKEIDDSDVEIDHIGIGYVHRF